MKSDTFFDLREFLITLLKKVRLCIFLTILCAVGGVLIRAIPLVKEYINFDKISVEELAATDTDYPYLYQARRTLYIEPIYKNISGETVDVSSNVIATYLACYQNKAILQPLVDKYFKEAAILTSANQEAQLKYQFINAASKKDFMSMDFYRMLEIKSVNNRLISIYAKSGDADFSEKLVSDFEELLSAQVKQLVGEYTYGITEGQIGISLPEDKTGVVLSPTLSTSSVRERPSISYIAKRCIKGGIWGLGLGIALSILWSFLFYSVSQLVYEENDLTEFQLPVLASITDKSTGHKLTWTDRLIAFLRGNKVEFCDYFECGKVIFELISQKQIDKTGKIAVTGSCEYSIITKMTEALNREGKNLDFIPVANIVYSAEALRQLDDISNLLIIEKLNDSSKAEIHREVERARYLEKTILGFIVVR